MREDVPAFARSESVFSEIIDEVTERLVRGETFDFDEFHHRCPEHAEQLRRLLHTLTLLHSPVVSPTDQEDETADPQSIGVVGEFTIIRELGRGGMGIVYEATQLSLDRRVALKILPFASILDERPLKRFKNEARAAAMLKHPGIVSVYSTGCEHGVHYYAMELIDGQSLATFFAQDKEDSRLKAHHSTKHGSHPRVDPAIEDTQPLAALSTQFESNRKTFCRGIARLGIQAAEALEYAHQEGVIHRDIKPSNLLVDQHGKLHITDFGLARIQTAEDLTLTGDLVGTLRYMSPEQLEGNVVVDQRTDVYSLGLTLYELLARQPAFTATARGDLVNEIINREPRSLQSCDRTIPADLATVVAKSIAKDPAERYTLARELANDLTRFLEHKPIRARRMGMLPRSWRWCQRNPSKAILLALVNLILLMLAIGGPVIAVRQTNESRVQAKLAEERRVALYESDMAKAHQHVENGEIDQAVHILRSYLHTSSKQPR